MNSWGHSRAEHSIEFILNNKPKRFRIEQRHKVTYLKLANGQGTHGQIQTAEPYRLWKPNWYWNLSPQKAGCDSRNCLLKHKNEHSPLNLSKTQSLIIYQDAIQNYLAYEEPGKSQPAWYNKEPATLKQQSCWNYLTNFKAVVTKMLQEGKHLWNKQVSNYFQ